MAEGAAAELPSITIEGMLIEPDETIWRALTEADLIAQWFMPNDFSPEVGHKLTSGRSPSGLGTACRKARFWRPSLSGGCNIAGAAARMSWKASGAISIRF